MTYAHLPAKLVFDAATRYLDKRQAHLKLLEDQAVNELIAYTKPGRVGRLLGLKGWTEDEARKSYRISDSSLFDQLPGHYQAKQVQGVLALATQAVAAGVATVALDADMATLFEESGTFKTESGI